MLVGHYAAGLIAKRIEPRLSLGTCVAAAMLADLLWAMFLIAGIEHDVFGSGKGAANYLVSADIGFSHSLLMDIVWAALLAGTYFLSRRSLRGSSVLFCVVLSHWLCDFTSLSVPLVPWTQRHAGLWLWRSIPLTLSVEGALWIGAIVYYMRGTKPATRWGALCFWVVVVFLTLVWWNNIAGPPPRDSRAAPIQAEVFFLLTVGWAYWMNRLRTPAVVVS